MYVLLWCSACAGLGVGMPNQDPCAPVLHGTCVSQSHPPSSAATNIRASPFLPVTGVATLPTAQLLELAVCSGCKGYQFT